MGQELGLDGPAGVFPLSDRFAKMGGIPVNDDGGEQVKPGHAVVLALAGAVVEQGPTLARAPEDASSRQVPSLRYPFIPAGAALSVRGSSNGQGSRSPRPPPDRSQQRLI